jgi:hypothetical protein
MKSILSLVNLRLIFATLILSCSMAVSQNSSPNKTSAITVVDMPASELLKIYRKELSYLDIAVADDQLNGLLKKTGERVEAFFRDFSNVSAKELILMQKKLADSEPGQYSPSMTGELQSLLAMNNRSVQNITKDFNYIILPRFEAIGFSFTEYRTDKKNRVIDPKTASGSFVMSSGYAGLCLFFHPMHQASTRFRYLGRETKAPRAHVIAFAQKPESGDNLSQYFNINSSKSIRFLTQGFVWLDPDSYQIIRMRTSMQFPEQKTILREQITDALYKKVDFDDTRQQFWLPSEVKVRWELPGLVYWNLHKYSDYHWFTVESDSKIAPLKSH